MLVGELISRFDDEATAAEAVLDLGDLSLVTSIANMAADNAVSVGEFVATTVRHFITHASDTDWVTLFGKLSGSQDPGRAFLHFILSGATSPEHDHSGLGHHEIKAVAEP